MERSLIVHTAYREAQDKFNNFVLGVNFAICAYLAQTMKFGPVGANVETMFLVALLVFGASAICGFKHNETVIVGFSLNHQKLDAFEKGNVNLVGEMDKLMQIARVKAHRFYRMRNMLLLCGFLCFLAAKLLAAYIDG
jgi:hypothetical protein